MFEWKVEDMVLSNEDSKLFVGCKEKLYRCEPKVSREDKIAFVDSMQDGKLSYILELADKFEKDKETLPKDKWGHVKTVSLKAWLKRNDTRKIVDDKFHYGEIYFLHCSRYIYCLNKRQGYGIYEDYVNEVFHKQLQKCEAMEKQYFLEHDEYSILKQKFRDKKYNTTFGVHTAMCSNGDVYVVDDDGNKREITIDELKELIEKYEQLDKLVEKLTMETHIIY